jgi:hypothetical protein
MLPDVEACLKLAQQHLTHSATISTIPHNNTFNSCAYACMPCSSDRREQYSALCAIVLQQDMPLLASGGLHSTIDFSNTLTITHHRILRGCMETTTPQAIHGRYHCRACV